MIYASDLDRTLIYSDRFLSTYGWGTDGVKLADKSSIDSYISNKVLDGLETISSMSNIRFIPITTRNLSQYTRVNLGNIQPEYAVTSNGGVILHNGQRVAEWDRYIEQNINKRELEEIVLEFSRIPGISREPTIVDGVFIFTKYTNINSVNGALHKLREKYTSYRFIIEKMKLYAIPEVVRKENALMWLKEKLKDNFMVASGDSEFDMGMLSIADIPVIPKHNTIKEESIDKIKDKVIIVEGLVDSPLKTFEIIYNLGEFKDAK